MASWKFLLSVVVLYMIALSCFKYRVDRKEEESMKCLNQSGDGSVVCHFMDDVKIFEFFNVTKIIDGSSNYAERNNSTILKIHSHNLPERMPGLSHAYLI